jgi:hypothetical protein
MRMLWCWRCKAEMPMLDDQEFVEFASLYRAGFQSLKERRATMAVMLVRYEAITGYRETNPRAIMHHRLSLYGPPCTHCGKPLRTPRAKLCGSCMLPVSEAAG